MKYKNIFWGIVLIAFGIMIILKNMEMVHFNWFAIIQLWPLLLVIWGISLIPVKEYIKFILSLVVLIAGIFLVSSYQCSDSFCWNWKFNDHKTKWTEQRLEEDYDSTITQAVLKLDAVAGDYTIKETTAKLISFESKGNIGNYDLQTSTNDSMKIVEIGVESNVVNIGNNHKSNASKIALNPNPVWDLELDAAASNVNFDLSEIKVRKIDFEGGASSVNLKIGNKQPLVNIKIEAGATSIKVLIPMNASCELDGDNVLSSKNLKGFEKTSDNKYRTTDFEKNPVKIYVDLDAAISSIDIERY
ncbi:MAG: LiaF transmembrane domain-containing protein [Bacteroidales bacterium]